jgi:hypothetical protein
VARITVWESVSGRPVEIESSSLVRTPTGYAIQKEDLAKTTAASVPAPTSTLEERLSRVEAELTRLSDRVDRGGRFSIVRDAGGRITGLLSEPAVTKHQPLVRNQ